MKRIFFFLLLFSCSAFAGAEMSGVHLTDFKNFEKNWKMVTVRFRKDTGELRFTYANAQAWKALKAGGKSYPKGAVFAKIGLATDEDPSFPSSAVPSGARRFQFMIRDEKKFKETDGWGYALFDAEGKLFPGDLHDAVLACAACHAVVPERTYVFSEIMDLSPGVKQKNVVAEKSRMQFETLGVDALPKNILNQIPPKTPQVRKVIGPLNELMFQGTLDEIRPSLYKEAIRASMPAMLFNKAGTSYSLVLLVDKKTKCAADETEVMSIIQNLVEKNTLNQIFCIPKEK